MKASALSVTDQSVRSSALETAGARMGRAMRRISAASVRTPERCTLFEADLDGRAALLLALVDWDVIHSHPVLLGYRRGIGQPHGVAVVEDLALAVLGAQCVHLGGGLGLGVLEVGLLVIEDGNIVAAIGVFSAQARNRHLNPDASSRGLWGC